MYKIIKKIVKAFLYLIVIVPLIPIALWAVMLMPGVQDTILNKAVKWFKSETGSTIKFSEAGITGVSTISFKDLLILHPKGDTIVFSKEASFSAAALYQLLFMDNPNLAKIRKLQFDNSIFNLAIDSVGELNLQFFISYLESIEDTTIPPTGKPFRIKNIQITNSVFTLKQAIGDKRPYGIDFNDLRCENLNIDVKNLTIIRDTVRMDIKLLAFKEKSGFVVNKYSSKFELCKHHLFFDDVKVSTPLSSVNTHMVHMSFEKYKNFQVKTLYQKINFGFAFYDTHVNLIDLGYFVDFFKDTDQDFDFAGNFDGPLSKFHCEDFIVRWGDASEVAGKFQMNGLPIIRETMFNVDFQKIVTSVPEMTKLNLPENYKIVLPENLKKIQQISYNGNFTGTINNFITKGIFHTNLGDLATDISIAPDTLNHVSFDGKISSKDLLLGSLVGLENVLGKITADATVKGVYQSKDRINALVDAQIKEFSILNYNYKDIDVNASYKNKKIKGNVNVSDPNLAMEAEGQLDFASEIPSYKIKTNVIDADLCGLNVFGVDSAFHTSFLAETELHGKNVDELNGEIRLINSLFSKPDRQIQIYDLNVNITNEKDNNRIVLFSDIMDLDFSGKYQFSKLRDDFIDYLSCYLPNFTRKTCLSSRNEHFTEVNLYAKLKRSQDFFDFFFPNFTIAENTLIKGSFSTGLKKKITIDAYSPKFRYLGNSISGIVINIISDDSLIYTNIGSQEINLNNRIRFENYTLASTAGHNKIDFTTRWLNWDTAIYRGKVSGNLLFGLNDSIRSYHLKLNPSEITIHDSVWLMNQSNITLKGGIISIDTLSFRQKDEVLMTHGILSDNPEDSLHFHFINFNLAYINFFTKRQGVEFIGKLSGNGYLLGIKNPLFFTDLAVDDLKINGEELGLCTLKSIWNNEKQSLSIEANAERENLDVLSLRGDYFPQSNGKLDFQMSLDKLKTDVFNPFLPGVFSNIKGLMTGNLELTGTAKRPSLSGKIKFIKNAFTVDYLKTRYNFTTDLEIASNNFILNKVEVFDQFGNSAIVNGIIRTEYLRKIDLNLNINAKNLLCLNTNSTDNKLYYGTAFASGNIKIKGRPSNLNFDVNATTGKDTRFYIPLSVETEVSDYNYITYLRNNTSNEVAVQVDNQYIPNLSGIQMDFKLHVTPEAEVQIIFDSKMGDIIKARGNGEIQMSINTMGTFDMVGEYIIQQGDYLFTLQNVINKKLDIQPGSTIRWSGDPLNAQVDITALYRKKVSLAPLFSADEKEMQGNATVDCQVFITGGLLKPNVKYGIDLPYAQEDIKEKVRSRIKTDEELTKQILSIIIMSQFYYVEGREGENAGKYAPGVNASELLSNQLSNWLSQISNDVDIGINYNPKTELSPSEVELILSTQLFNDRLSVNGSFDTKNVVEFDLDYKLNESGNLRARAYNRPNDFQTQDQNNSNTTYTQGVGIFYMEEFSSFQELMHKYWNILSGKSRKEKKSATDIDSN